MKTIKACKATASAAALSVLLGTGASAQFMDFSGQLHKLDELVEAVFSGTSARAASVPVPLMTDGQILAAEIIPSVDLREALEAAAAPAAQARRHERTFECEMGSSGGAGQAPKRVAFKATWKSGEAGAIQGAKVSIVQSSGGMAGKSIISTAKPAMAGGAAALVFELAAGDESGSEAACASIIISDDEARATCPGQTR